VPWGRILSTKSVGNVVDKQVPMPVFPNREVLLAKIAGGIQAIHLGPNTSKRNKLHAVHQYLLRNIDIKHSNQGWMVDITYLRMPNGFMYLVALIDVYSRYVVGWSLRTRWKQIFALMH
jgi:transposase InsO family protein